jgi:hypothetical protein
MLILSNGRVIFRSEQELNGREEPRSGWIQQQLFLRLKLFDSVWYWSTIKSSRARFCSQVVVDVETSGLPGRLLEMTSDRADQRGGGITRLF